MSLKDRIIGPLVDPIKREFAATEKRMKNDVIRQSNENKVLKKELKQTKEVMDSYVKEFDFTVLKTGYGEAPPLNSQEYLKEYKDWIYANVNVIAEAVADMMFELYSMDGKENVKKEKSNQLLELLYKPNSFQTKWEMIYNIMVHLLLLGESAVYKAGMTAVNSKPTQLWTLRPDFLRMIPGDVEKNEFVFKYIYQIPGKDAIEFAPWEILFMRIPNPTNAYRGMGVVEASMDTIQTNTFSTNWNKNFFFNSARPDAVLMTDRTLNDEVLERLQKKWYQKFGNRANSSQRVAVLEAGLKYQQVQMTAKDMDFLEGQKWTRDKIMAMFRNTKMALGITEDVNRANAEASEYMHLKYTIKPKMRRICDYLNEYLVPAFGQNLFLGFEDPIPENQDLKIKKWEVGFNKVYTVNELREEEGLDPVEGGDFIYMPLGMVPLGTDPMQPTDTTGKMSKQLPYLKLKVKKGLNVGIKKRNREIIAKINNRNVRITRMRKESVDIIKQMLRNLLKKKYEKIDDDAMVKFHHANNEFANKVEPKAITGIRKVLDDMENEALKRAEKRKSFEFDDKEEYSERIAGVLGLSEEELIILVGKEALDLLRVDQQFISTTQKVKEYLETNTLKASESFTSTVKSRISKILQEATENGTAYVKVSKQIKQLFNDMSKFETNRLVRTEMSRAITFGTLEGYRQSGVVYGKQWYTAIDERVCDECGEMHGKTFADDIDGNFADLIDTKLDFDYTNGMIDGPPLHPMCRCDLLPITVDTKGAKTSPKVKKIKKIEEVDRIKALEEELDEIINEKI